MGTPSLLSAADGLFAAKGRAVPLDKTRPENTAIDAASNIPAMEPDGGTAALPGIFADNPDETAADGAAGGTGPGEPPPAASLLTIASQESAARARRPARAVPEPETNTDAAVPAGEMEADATDPNDAAPDAPVYLPVPVTISLPSVIARPDGPKHLWYGNAALLAASIAVLAAMLVAGTITLYPAETPTPSRSAGIERPQPAERDTVPAGTNAPDILPLAATAPKPRKAEIASVRFENAGRVVVKGSAPPETELIVLRNRRPLGAVRSGPGGAWTFSASVPLQTEQHEISVVTLRIDTSVLVDQPSFVPRPKRRPPLPSSGAGSASYFVQIASLPTAADAGREAEKLMSRLSGAFAANRISVRATTIEQDRKVYRVAIGGFSTKESAIAACGHIRALKTPCLIMQEP